MDPLAKEAFSRVKEDILTLKQDLDFLNSEIKSLKELIESLSLAIQTDQQTLRQTHIQTDQRINPHINTQKPDITPELTEPIHNNIPQYGLKSQNSSTSNGNRGVPTDRQTDQQTNRHPIISDENKAKITQNQQNNNNLTFSKQNKGSFNIDNSNISKITELLNSLDDIKKELRLKFKRITNQEMLIFSSIYQLEDQGFPVDYSILANNLSLTESSIRDYVKKLIDKGIPILKYKENNKKIVLSIDPNLKKIASLSTIISLREI